MTSTGGHTPFFTSGRPGCFQRIGAPLPRPCTPPPQSAPEALNIPHERRINRLYQ